MAINFQRLLLPYSLLSSIPESPVTHKLDFSLVSDMCLILCFSISFDFYALVCIFFSVDLFLS